jgi:hypothetical protein
MTYMASLKWPDDAPVSRTAASILVRVRTRSQTPAQRITGDPTTIVARHRLLAEVSEHDLPLRAACPRLFRTRSSLTSTLQFLSGTKCCGDAGSRSTFLPGIGQPGAIRVYARRKRSGSGLGLSMCAAELTVELVETKRLTNVHPRDARNRLRRSISSLDASLVRIRPPFNAPLEYWKVFLLRVRDDVVGVSGLYRQPGMAHNICWVGWFAFALVFDDRGLAEAQCTHSSTLAKTSLSKNFGFIQARRTISQSIFTRLSALKSWVQLAIGRLGELWMIRTLY